MVVLLRLGEKKDGVLRKGDEGWCKPNEEVNRFHDGDAPCRAMPLCDRDSRGQIVPPPVAIGV